MKFFVAVASLALITAASAQGPVDASKLPTGWCMTYSEMACGEAVVPEACGANSTWSTTCNSTFSNDKVCTSFKVSCLCTPTAGGQQKDLSLDAFNKTFEILPYNMCGNLIAVANTGGPGLVSGDYKPDGKRPNATTSTSASATASSATVTTTAPSGGKNGAATLQMALSTVGLAAISLGLAMIPM